MGNAWIAFFCGLFIGGSFGTIIIGLCCAAREANADQAGKYRTISRQLAGDTNQDQRESRQQVRRKPSISRLQGREL